MESTVKPGWDARGLKARRMARGLTMQAMADASGINLACISQHESGKREMLPQTARKYAAYYKVPFTDIMEVRTCQRCGEEKPLVSFPALYCQTERAHSCRSCRGRNKTMNRRAESARERVFTKAELLAYVLGYRRLKKEGLKRAEIIRELADDHSRDPHLVVDMLGKVGL